MDNEKFAPFIAELRKEKRLTQKELADQLGVTDKAVSKWERGLSCPDISLITKLSDILGTTAGELLNGEKAKAPAPEPEVKSIIETTLHYADTVIKHKNKDLRMMYSIILSSVSLLGIIVCTICNFAITGYLTWALFPISSILFAWVITIPMLISSSRGPLISLTLFSLLIIPFLFILERIIGVNGLIMPIGIRVSVVGIIYLWIIYLLFAKTRLQAYISAAVSVIIALPAGIWINYTISKLIGEPLTDIWDILTYFILISISVLTLVIGYARCKKITK